MTDETKSKMLEQIADVFIVHSLESFNAHVDLTNDEHELGMWSTLQDIIDHVNDHNELMLEAITAVSPDLARFIDELMNDFPLDFVDGEECLAWVHVVNSCFRAVRRRLGEDVS